jgi:hypothetical protein
MLPKAADENPMLHLADKFKFLLMDTDAALAARLVGSGANYWRTAGGGLSVARNATIVNLGRRQAGQVSALLDIQPMHAPQNLPRDRLPAHLALLLEPDEPCTSPTSYTRERASA